MNHMVWRSRAGLALLKRGQVEKRQKFSFLYCVRYDLEEKSDLGLCVRAGEMSNCLTGRLIVCAAYNTQFIGHWHWPCSYYCWWLVFVLCHLVECLYPTCIYHFFIVNGLFVGVFYRFLFECSLRVIFRMFISRQFVMLYFCCWLSRH